MRFSQTRRQSLQLIGAGLIAGCAAHPARRQNADASGSYRSGPALPFPVQEIYPCGNTPVHEAYDPATDRWETLSPMPKGQGGLASGVVDGKLYTFGGEWFEDGGGVYPDAWVYDPDRDSWASLADMPKPRHGLGGVALGGDIYLIGGAAQRGGNQTSAAVQIYTP